MALCMCRKSLPPAKREYYFQNVLFLGNAITLAPPGPAYQWTGNWGMAATVADSDYVHIVTRKLRGPAPNCLIAIKNIDEFEFHFNSYDIGTELRASLDSKPDLVVVRIGENVDPDFDREAFNKRYAALINYIKSNDPNATIFAVGSFWSGKAAVDTIMKRYSAYASLSKLGQDMSNYSWGMYPNKSVQLQPCNKGMKAIAGVIWNGIDSLRKTRPFVQ